MRLRLGCESSGRKPTSQEGVITISSTKTPFRSGHNKVKPLSTWEQAMGKVDPKPVDADQEFIK